MSDIGVPPPGLSIEELIQLGAVDSPFFCHTFFPKAFRGTDPDYAKTAWAALENPGYPYLLLKIFRGGMKTTLLRAFLAKRIGYGISRTALFIGASEGHAFRSVQWVRNQIEPRLGANGQYQKTLFAQTFGLEPGNKWQESEAEVVQQLPNPDGTFSYRTCWLTGVGITGSVRGINFDDYRPDLIVLDDVLKDESVRTQAQREKINELILGAVKNSLAAEVDAPNRKLAMLQTPLDADDASAQAERNPEWHTEEFACWTPETRDLPLDEQVSSWEEYFPTEQLRREKLAAIATNKYSVFAREMEVRTVTAETKSFRPNWIRLYEPGQPPKVGATIIAIDPVAPPSEAQIAKGLRTKDQEAIGVLGRAKEGYVVMEYVTSKGHTPEWTATKLFEFKMKYRPQAVVISLVSAERYLKWFLEKEMERRQQFLPIKEAVIGGQSKLARIVAALSGPASNGKLWACRNHTEFLLQFENYGLGYRGHDDILDMIAAGVAELTNPFLELGADEFFDMTADQFPLPERAGACP